MNTELHTIRSVGGKDVPDGTLMWLRLGSLPGTATVDLQLPGQERNVRFENLSIKDGVLTLPVPLVFLCYAEEDSPEAVSYTHLTLPTN